MRIAQVAPLYESVPPKYYGGTERVVSYLTEELVNQGHDVTLFASGDSETKARLVPATHRSLRLDKHCVDQVAHHVFLLERVAELEREFDIIHFHLGYLHFPMTKFLKTPHLSTQHGRLDIPDVHALYAKLRDIPNVSISNEQRTPMPWLNWVGTVYHGLPEDLLPYREGPGEYFAFLGRISPEKRVDRAIAIATKLEMPLRIAAKVDDVDLDYFETTIRPLLDHPLIDFIGEIGEGEKAEFLGNAIALLFPIDWPEPFGLVMIEAMSCGTPVIAFRHGSVPEVIDDGVTGYVVDSLEDAIAAAERVGDIDRLGCRETWIKRFSASQMAAGYLDLYQRCIDGAFEPPEGEPQPDADALAARTTSDTHPR